jgi:hypothetical protein
MCSFRVFILNWMVNSWPRNHITDMLENGDLPDELIREALPIALSLTQPMPSSQSEKEIRHALF